MKNLIIIFSIVILSIGQTFAQNDLLDEIATSLRSGDARSVSRYFGNTIDLTIITQEEVYSKVQAEQILKDFFLKNQPRSFTIIHKGESKEGARYAIGSLVTNSGQVFRTYFYMKQQGNTAIIQELRFMKE